MPGSEIVKSIRPYDGSLLWEGEAASQAEVAATVARARKAQPGWFAAGLDARLAVVRAFKAVVEADTDAFARLIAEETGKPFWEAKTEVGSVAAKVEISITAHAERTGSREGVFKADPAGANQALRHKPHGVLAVFGGAPLFFYLIHLYGLHLLNLAALMLFGANQGEGFGVPGVGWVWLLAALVAVPCWFACRWFGGVKRRSSQWWMKYL